MHVIDRPNDSKNAELLRKIEHRVGHLHLKRRLGIERESEARIFGQGRTFVNIENWVRMHSVIRTCLRLALLYRRAQLNVVKIGITQTTLPIDNLPAAFEGYRLLHISDPHLDIVPDMTTALISKIESASYDLCVITGDYRARTHGDHSASIEAMRELRPHIKTPVYSVLGNHDTILMVPDLEEIGVQMLMNEHVVIEHRGEKLWLAGIDDPHYFRTDNIEKACREIPVEAASILLAHSPEIYKHAAYADFSAMLCGHTHGGQICLPGGKPIYCNAACSHRYCSGLWRHNGMTGYTSRGSGSSLVDARLNCPPEITIHHLSNVSPH